MTIILRGPKMPWHWRIRRFLGFDSCRRGVLFIPTEIKFRETDDEVDAVTRHLMEYLTKPLTTVPRPRLYRFRKFLGDDRVRRYDQHRASVVPIIVRGPAAWMPKLVV